MDRRKGEGKKEREVASKERAWVLYAILLRPHFFFLFLCVCLIVVVLVGICVLVFGWEEGGAAGKERGRERAAGKGRRRGGGKG